MARTAKWLQLSVVAFQDALGWTVTLRLKPPKCRTLALRKFRQDEKMNFHKVQDNDYSCYDPLIVIDDQKVKFVGDDNPPMFKYLGMWIQSDLKENIVVEKVEE